MSDNRNQQPGQQFQLELKPEVASGAYSSRARISHSHSDFIVDFSRILPGMPKPEVFSRIILAPEHAKRLLAALQDNIVKYEKEFGPIAIPQPAQKEVGPRTIAPFGNGEA